MKFRHLLTAGILTMILLTASAVTAFAGEPSGRFEKVTGTAISGWAYNSDSPDAAVNVMITITNKNTGEEVFSRQVSAGEYKEKLYEENKGNGCHGFTVSIDWSAYPDGVYLIEGGVGDKDLSNPRTYKNNNGQGAQTAPSGKTAQASQTNQSAQAASAGQNLVDLGVFETTAYCPCKSCSGGWGRNTCTGAIATAGHTISVDPRVIPFGSKVMINGVVYTAEDRGGGVKGRHIDIFFNTHPETVQYGLQHNEVYLVKS